MISIAAVKARRCEILKSNIMESEKFSISLISAM